VSPSDQDRAIGKKCSGVKRTWCSHNFLSGEGAGNRIIDLRACVTDQITTVVAKRLRAAGHDEFSIAKQSRRLRSPAGKACWSGPQHVPRLNEAATPWIV